MSWARFHGWAKEKARTRLGSGVAHRVAKQVVSSVFAAASPSICELISARSKGSSIVVARCFASDKRSCRPRTTDLMRSQSALAAHLRAPERKRRDRCDTGIEVAHLHRFAKRPTAFRAGKGLRVPIAAMWRMFDGLVFAPIGSSNRFTTTAASSATLATMSALTARSAFSGIPGAAIPLDLVWQRIRRMH